MAEAGAVAPINGMLKSEKLNFPKKVAIDSLKEIQSDDEEIHQSAKKLLKCLEENGKEPAAPLSASELIEFVKILEELKGKSTSENGLGIQVHQLMGASINKITLQEVIEEKLNVMQMRQQTALDRIRELEQDLNDERKQRREDRLRSEEEIRDIRETISSLENEKQLLKREIRELKFDKEDLQRQIDDLKVRMDSEAARNKQTLEEHAQMLLENNLKEIDRMREDVNDLKEENRKLKIHKPYKLVGYCITLITNGLYKYVHNNQELKKNYYSIDELESHLLTKYRGNEEGKRAAQGRWEEIKREIDWTEETKFLVDQLAGYREKGSGTLKVSVTYSEFSEAVRVMVDGNELDTNDMELIRDLFVKCDEKVNIQQTTRT